jgi:hypothetical protein
MARSVLKFERLRSVGFALIAVSLLAESSGGSRHRGLQGTPVVPEDVPASRQKEVQQFRDRVEAGPLYKELLRRVGKPGACKTHLEGETITLSCVFPSEMRLEARANTKIEFSEQRVELPGVNKREALTLLKESEKESFGRDSCGVHWNRPVEKPSPDSAGTREVVYRGDICNCQGRVIYKNSSIVALVWRSAC